MGAEVHVNPSLLAAARKQWSEVHPGWADECKKVRGGLLKDKGSENIGLMAWAIAFVISRLRPQMLPAWLTRREIDAWWLREMRDRRDHGLLLGEEDSRIYFGWGWGPIAAVWALAEGELKQLCRDWMRAQTAKMALCAVSVRPKRYDPPIVAKLNGEALFVPLCGARSWSTDDEDGKPGRESSHHMGSSAWESVCGAVLFNLWRPRQPAHQWELDLSLAVGKPVLFNATERGLLRAAVMNPDELSREALLDIAAIAGWGKAKWPCYLVRWENGGACVRYGRGSGVSTAPLYAMGIHDDGTIHYLALDSGARQGKNINYEPCGMDLSSGMVVAWAGGEDLPIKRLRFGTRWGQALWIVNVGRQRTTVVWPEDEHPPAPPPEPPGPEPTQKPERRNWFQRLWDKIRRIFG